MEIDAPFERTGGDSPHAVTRSDAETTFGVPTASRALGLIEYIVVLPTVAIFVCGAAAVIAFLVAKHFVGKGTLSTAAGIAAAAVALVLVARFAVRDYMQRAGSVVT